MKYINTILKSLRLMKSQLLKFEYIIICISSLIFAISCTNKKNSELQNALKLAGPNKKELKKVLDHYKKEPADSLKYKAACFLIENMPWHYGTKVNPSEQLWDLFVLEDSLIRPLLREPNVSARAQASFTAA